LHDLRKRAKRLRYLYEILPAIEETPSATVLEHELKRLQTDMGKYCDRYAQLAFITDSLREPSKGATHALLRRARQCLRASLQDHHAEVALRSALARFFDSYAAPSVARGLHLT
jgi:CHAD domain-containing protein